jgi:endonuclease/exonuclease/phosphatase family metal-dependent hydrolase
VKYAPFAATFQVCGTPHLLTVLSVHVSFGREDEAGREARRQEVSRLIALLDRLRAQPELYGETVLCGDFNLPPSDAVFRKLRSTLHYREANTLLPTNVGLKRYIYDNFFVDNGHSAARLDTFAVVQFEGILVMSNEENRATFRRCMSDHLPIALDFHFVHANKV